jgi:hypothetical protein
MRPFNYASAAELFPTRNLRARRTSVGYRRFNRAAEAIRFAIEELPPELLHGAHMEVDEERFDSGAIRRLYEDAGYPLPRKKAAAPAGNNAEGHAMAKGQMRSNKEKKKPKAEWNKKKKGGPVPPSRTATGGSSVGVGFSNWQSQQPGKK